LNGSSTLSPVRESGKSEWDAQEETVEGTRTEVDASGEEDRTGSKMDRRESSGRDPGYTKEAWHKECVVILFGQCKG